jgi:hypothetical protein
VSTGHPFHLVVGRARRIHENSDRRGVGPQLAHQPQPLRLKVENRRAYTRDVAARPIEAGDEPAPDRVAADEEDDRYAHGRRLGGQRRYLAAWCKRFDTWSAAAPANRQALSRLRNCCCSAGACACSFDLDDHLNLDSVVEGKPRHPHGRARVLADRLAKDFNHQIRKSVNYPRLVTKPVSRVDHA